MKPYYAEDGITIYHGDALEIAGELPQCDLMVMDPPFFMPAQRGVFVEGWYDNMTGIPSFEVTWEQLDAARAWRAVPRGVPEE